MKPDARKKYAGWLACAVVAAAICAAVVLYERSYAQWGLFRMLCDGCFAASVLFHGLGALAWVSSFGGFTALGYGWYLLVRKLSASRKRFEARLSYLEYVQSRKETDKCPACVFVTGLVCLAAAAVFLYLYRRSAGSLS